MFSVIVLCGTSSLSLGPFLHTCRVLYRTMHLSKSKWSLYLERSSFEDSLLVWVVMCISNGVRLPGIDYMYVYTYTMYLSSGENFFLKPHIHHQRSCLLGYIQ